MQHKKGNQKKETYDAKLIGHRIFPSVAHPMFKTKNEIRMKNFPTMEKLAEPKIYHIMYHIDKK